MTELEKKLDGLRKAHEAGILDEGTYQSLVADAQDGVTANIEGSGSSAQAGQTAVAAGAGGAAVAGNVEGDVNIDNRTFVQPEQPNPKTAAGALKVYRRLLASSCGNLPLRGIDIGASDPTSEGKKMELAQVYVDLDTTTTVPKGNQGKWPNPTYPAGLSTGDTEEQRALSTLQAVIGCNRAVILGDPGSGKTTFLNHLCLCLAAHSLEPKAGWHARLKGWPKNRARIIPIQVVLRDFARATSDKGKAQARHLWDFIVSRLKDQDLQGAVKPLREAVDKGKAIFFLDGLDEMPTDEQRVFVREAIEKFANSHSECQFVVTCRTLSYQEKEWQLDNFPSFQLAALDKEKIKTFIEAWYKELARVGTVQADRAKGLSAKLSEAVGRSELRPLAPNPLLLTVMSLVHAHKGRLPDARALLYEDTIDILLWRWEELKADTGEDAPIVRQLLLDCGRSEVDLKRALASLAFDAHRSGGSEGQEKLADISENQLLTGPLQPASHEKPGLGQRHHLRGQAPRWASHREGEWYLHLPASDFSGIHGRLSPGLAQ
jgi:hypothetical protein